MLEGVRLGAVDFLERPLSQHKLRTLWQHKVGAAGFVVIAGPGWVHRHVHAAPFPALRRAPPGHQQLVASWDGFVLHAPAGVVHMPPSTLIARPPIHLALSRFGP